MTWPHFLSLSRVIAGPIIAALILARPGTSYVVAAILFALASLTDAVDGKLARYAQSVSPLGIFLDTTADKVLVAATLVAMATAGIAPAWVVIVIIGREFLISGLRSFAAARGRIISAHAWGKGKTAITMAGIVLTLLAFAGRDGALPGPGLSVGTWARAINGSQWLLGLAAVLTIVSGIRYFIDAWPLLTRPEVPREGQRRMAGTGR